MSFTRTRFYARAATLVAAIGALSPALLAQQNRTANDRVYTDAQATRGQALYQKQCSQCHGQALGGGVGPPLAGNIFSSAWAGRPLSDLANKIRNTMPLNDPGKLTPSDSVDLVAYVLQAGKFPSGRTDLAVDEAALKNIVLPGAKAQPNPAAAAKMPAFPPAGNLTQVMRGILFPSSNIIFNVQTYDPATTVKPNPTGADPTASFSWVNWGAGIYKGWEIIDYAAVAIAESAPLMLTPGRRCENGRPVPVENADWIKFSQELAEAGRAAYRASQTRNQEVVSDVTNQLADACLHCHEVYRDKPGGTVEDPSSKALRCVPLKK